MLRSLEWVVVVNDGQLLVQVISCFVILPVMSQSWQFREENHGPLEDCIDRLRAKLNTADAMNIVYRSENRDLERQVDKLVQEKLGLEAQVNYLQTTLGGAGRAEPAIQDDASADAEVSEGIFCCVLLEAILAMRLCYSVNLFVKTMSEKTMFCRTRHVENVGVGCKCNLCAAFRSRHRLLCHCSRHVPIMAVRRRG